MTIESKYHSNAGLTIYCNHSKFTNKQLPRSGLCSAFTVTAERVGIATYYQDFIDNRQNSVKPPVDDIHVINNYENISERKSFLHSNGAVQDALQRLVCGSFKYIDNQIIYQDDGVGSNSKISTALHEAPPSVKSLFSLDCYINHLAQEGDFLVINEPEICLSISDQRAMGSLIARLVNAGVKVVITTNSDFLFREINNLIMLNNDFSAKELIMKKAKLTEDDILGLDQVVAYNLSGARNPTVMPIDNFGINNKLFDGVIAKANSLSDEIYSEIE